MKDGILKATFISELAQGSQASCLRRVNPWWAGMWDVGCDRAGEADGPCPEPPLPPAAWFGVVSSAHKRV